MDHNQDIVAGLDIGTTKIACIIGRKNEQGKIEILGMGKAKSDGVSRGVVANIQKTVESIKAAVREAGDNAGVDISTVNVGIAGQHIRSMQHRGMRMRESLDQEVTQSDIDALIDDTYRLMMPPGEEIIHVLPQEYIVDSEQGIRDPIGMSGIRMEANFHIISGQVTAARNIYKCVHRADLHVTELILEPLASADAVLSNEEKEAGVVLVDIGGGTTDIAIFFDNIIRHTAVIPFGGNVITEDIRQGCGIMREQAELLKTKFGSALASENKENEVVCIPGLRGRDPKEISLRTLAEIIQSRMEEILDHVYFEIKNSGIEKQLIAGIVLTGGGAQLKHLKHLVEVMTGMSTRIGYPNEHIAKSAVEDVTSPLHATGVGLVMKGFDYLERRRPKALEVANNRDAKVVVKGHSKGPLSGFFSNIINSASEILKDDEN
ncbi:MAG: cell division protein FtsA [Flavobacteriales bacterium]|jgi:cell division protein FtsA|nr:MAG: cell division protein FtsA [Flavobacteriales bacterium]